MENWNPEHSVRPGHLLMVWLEHQWHSSLVFTGTVTSIREAKDIKEGDGKRRRGHYTPGCAEGKGRGLRSDQQSWWVLCLLVQTTSDTTSDSQTNREEKKTKKLYDRCQIIFVWNYLHFLKPQDFCFLETFRQTHLFYIYLDTRNRGCCCDQT